MEDYFVFKYNIIYFNVSNIDSNNEALGNEMKRWCFVPSTPCGATILDMAPT